MDKRTSLDGDPPTTYQGDLAKLPKSLAPLLARVQWAVWRWVRKKAGGWSKPPFIAADPSKHASTKDPSTWADHTTALATVSAGHAKGITYILTEDDGLAAIDIDHCRDPSTSAIADWAQQLIDQATGAYVEVTPSGTGLRIWGAAKRDKLHRKVAIDVGKDAAIELFRRTHKALTVTGLEIGSCRTLGNIDQLVDHAAAWAERHKAAGGTADKDVANGSVAALYDIEDFDRILREGAPGEADRSALFHTIVGHLSGCGWNADQIATEMEKYPDGVGARYLVEGRLRGEIGRSLDKYQARKSAQALDTGGWNGGWRPTPLLEQLPKVTDLGLDPDPKDSSLEEEPEEPQLELPPMFSHGDPDPRPLKAWAIKRLMPQCGHGLLSGQWGTFKSFVALELAVALMNGQPFLGYRVKRQSGVLFLAAEGANEMRLRLNALAREKCGGTQRLPFRWYETVPTLLQPSATNKLVAMAKLADASLQQEFGLPLGLIIIDTIAACAGYAVPGAENDTATTQHVMNILKAMAQQMGCFVLGVDHFGKVIETGTRGSSSKEAAADLVLPCLGERELTGRVVNTRLAIRKSRGGLSGQEFPFDMRVVEEPVPDEDGEPVTTLVVEWGSGISGAKKRPPSDPWEQSRQTGTRQAMLLLRRVLMSVLAGKGVSLPSAPDGPEVRMVDRDLVRDEFYLQTAVEGTPQQKQDQRRKRFRRAVDRAQETGLIGIREIDGTIYFWLAQVQAGSDEDF
jgi:hypothetical protein